MKRMRLKLALILFLFLIFNTYCNRREYPLSKGEKLVNSLLAKTAKNIKDKYKLRPCGVGVAMPGGPIREVTLCFDTTDGYTQTQLRGLLIKISLELLEQIVENNEIQAFLKEIPFTIKNVEVIIYNHDENGRSLKDPQISVASISQGILYYYTIDPENNFKYKNEYEESYEEALRIFSDPFLVKFF